MSNHNAAASFLQKYQRRPANAPVPATAVLPPLVAPQSTEMDLTEIIKLTPHLSKYTSRTGVSEAEGTVPKKVDFSMGIGCDCASAAALRFAKLRPCSLPLDWIRSSPESTRRIILLHEPIPNASGQDGALTPAAAMIKPSSLQARQQYFKAFHPAQYSSDCSCGDVVEEGPDPLMAPCDSDADDEGGATIVSLAHRIASGNEDASDWTLLCPLFDGLEAAVKVARLRSSQSATGRSVITVSSDTLPVYHRLDTQQYFTTPLEDSTATNVNGASTGPPREPQETFYFDRNFGLIANREEALNAQRRMIRIHWAMREMRKQLCEPHKSKEPLRVLFLCTGRVVGDCPEVTARVNGNPLVSPPSRPPLPLEGNENAQLSLEALSVLEAFVRVVTPSPTTRMMRPLEVNLMLINVGMNNEIITLSNPDCPGASVHIRKQFVGYPSASKPWANVGALSSEVLTTLFAL